MIWEILLLSMRFMEVTFDHKVAPARETVQVAALPKNVRVEISVIAIR